jgi:hypothetical protein
VTSPAAAAAAAVTAAAAVCVCVSRRVCVWIISSAGEAELSELFGTFGALEEVHVVTDK